MSAMHRMPSGYKCPKGYKQTEVGVIPEDWEVQSIGNIVSISVGRDLKEENYSTYQDAIFNYPVFSNTVSDEGLYGWYNVPEYNGDSLTVVGRGVGLGRAFKRSGGYGAIGRLLVLFPDADIDANFLTEYINNSVRIFSESGGIPQLTGVSFSKYRIPLPPTVTEQCAIATALSDVDALLAAQDKLIAKKRDIKQAAMQQLLTGKQRLPGFSGEWEVKLLGEIARIKTGGKNNDDKIEDGEYPLFVRSQTIERINSYSYDCEAILVPGEGGIGSIFHYIDGRFDVHQRVYAITQFAPDVLGKFVYLYMLMNFGEHAMKNSVKATVDSLRLPTFHEFEVALPPMIEEQTAIAAVLSDMDDDLAALEQQRDKTRALKQGMMQELLTGRIRLVESGELKVESGELEGESGELEGESGR